MGYYWILLGASRAERQYGSSEELARQQNEMIANLTGIFDHYSFMWRWLLYYAVTAPTLSLKWRIILDPASAYYIGVERAHDWVIERWDAAIACAAGLILLITLPFVYFDPNAWEPLYYAATPTLACAVTLFVLRVVLGIRPPSSYQRWIWWILLAHIIFAILNFSLSLNLGTHESFWSRTLWYMELWTIGAYPAVYLLGGERYRRINNPARRKIARPDDCDVEVRRRLLIALCDTEHRKWLLGRLVHHIHPVRSSRLQLWLVTPSLLLKTLKALRSGASLTLDLIKFFFGAYSTALRAWGGLMIVGWLLTLITHLFTHHQALPMQFMIAHTLDLMMLLLPTLIALLVSLMLSRSKLEINELTTRIINICVLIGAVSFSYWAWASAESWFPQWGEALDSARSYDTWLWWMLIPIIPLGILLNPLWRLIPRQKKSSSHNASTIIQTLDQRVEDSIQTLQNRLISSVYQRALRDRVFEQSFQNTLILCVARVIETSFDRIRSGRWFIEERHASSRVVSELLSKTQSESSQHFEPLEELSAALELSFDTLGSLLHDLCLTGLFNVNSHHEDERVASAQRDQNTPPLPTLSVIIDALCQLAAFPLPVMPLQDQGGDEGTLSNLASCHREVIALTGMLVMSSKVTRSFSREERLALTRLWCLLESQVSHPDQWRGALSPALGYIKKRVSRSALALRGHQEYRHNTDERAQASQDIHITPSGQRYESTQVDIKLNDTLSEPLTPHQTLELLSATLRHPRGSELLNQLLSHPEISEDPSTHAQLIDHFSLLILPTPIAQLYRDLLTVIEDATKAQTSWEDYKQKRQALQSGASGVHQGELLIEEERNKKLSIQNYTLQTAQSMPSSVQAHTLTVMRTHTTSHELLHTNLDQLQSPFQIKLMELELHAQQVFNRVHQLRYHALYHLYFGSCAYLFAAIKNRIEGHPQIDQLSWLNAEAVTHSLNILRQLELSDEIKDLHDLRELVFAIIDPEEAHLIEKICRDQRSWVEAHEVGRDLIERLIEFASVGRLPYFSWHPNDTFESRVHLEELEETQTQEMSGRLILRGVYPHFTQLRINRSDDQQQRSLKNAQYPEVSDSTLSDSTLSDSTLSDSTLSDSTLSDSTLSDSTLSDSTLSQKSVVYHDVNR